MGRGVAICPHPCANPSSLLRISFKYPEGSLLSVNIEIISTATNHHSSLNQVLRMFLPSNTTKALCLSIFNFIFLVLLSQHREPICIKNFGHRIPVNLCNNLL